MISDEKDAGLSALKRLIKVTQTNLGHSGAPVREFLAGLYNDDYAPSMWLLCTRISDADFADVIQVMRLIRNTRREPHEFFRNGSDLWRDITRNLRPHRSRWRAEMYDKEMEEESG